MSWWQNEPTDDTYQYGADGSIIKKKIISLGINKYEKADQSSIGNPQSPTRQFIERKQKMETYRDQLEKDKDSKIEHSRKPLKQPPVYSDDVSQSTYEGLRIGNDTSSNAVMDRKREAQRIYQAQLAEDTAAKKAFTENTPSRGTLYKKKFQDVEPKPFSIGAAVKQPEPSPRYPSYDYQGTGIDIGNNYSAEEQRTRALLHASRLKEDILMRIKYSEPISEVMQAETKRASRKAKEEDQETYEGFYIGTDEKTQKAHKKAAQVAYHAELEAAHGPSYRAPKNRGLIDTEVNITGWTGLNIGGVAADNTRSRQALNSKVTNQEKYRSQLDQQQATNALYRPSGDNYDPTAPLPYMKY